MSGLMDNTLLVAGIGTTITGSVLYLMRQVPNYVKLFLDRHIFTTVVMFNTDSLFDRVMILLSKTAEAQKARYLRMVETYDYDREEWVYIPTFGSGWHLLSYNGTKVLFHRDVDRTNGILGPQNTETLTLRTLGRRNSGLIKMIKDSENIWRDNGSIHVLMWHNGCYTQIDVKPKRAWNTIYLPQDQKRRILEDIDKFGRNKTLYRSLGLPYRRTYLFKGPPGTGKSSLAFALASHLNTNIHIINLKNIDSDAELMNAMSVVGKGSITLLEDIDTITQTNDRKSSKNQLEVETVKGISMSGLLNALDGIGSRDNRVIIMTTNHEDKLDEAIKRPGRVDLIEHIGLIEDEVVLLDMIRGFIPDEPAVNEIVEDITLPVSPATMQQYLMKRINHGKAEQD